MLTIQRSKRGYALKVEPPQVPHLRQQPHSAAPGVAK